MPSELMRKSDFARSQGWVPSYVSKLAKENRLVYGPDGKLVDVQKTLALLGKTADPSKAGVAQRHARGVDQLVEYLRNQQQRLSQTAQRTQ